MPTLKKSEPALRDAETDGRDDRRRRESAETNRTIILSRESVDGDARKTTTTTTTGGLKIYRVPMGWVRLPPSENARDVAVVPSGATKTIYLIRHAEGFHNQAGEVDPVRARYAKLIEKR